jgi:hypothetical protein
VSKIVQKQLSKPKKIQNIEIDQQRYVGVVKPGMWLYQLSLQLKIPLHTSFVAGPVSSVHCITLPLGIYNECIGNQRKKETQDAIFFMWQCGFGRLMT